MGKCYNLQKLIASGMFDIESGQQFHYNKIQTYFDSLEDFAANYVSGFGNYTPAVVVNSDENRAFFLVECYNARAQFMVLGISALLDCVTVMEDAAIKRDREGFADGQVKLRATLRICRNTIRAAEIQWLIPHGR